MVDLSGGTDIERYLEQIRAINKSYRNVVDKLRLIKGNKRKTEEKLDLLNARQALKEDFIGKKQAARANIALVKAKVESLAIVKEKELKDLQEDFREIDSEFKELGVLAEREELFEGAKRGGNDPSKMNNDQLLGAALDIQKQNKEKLKEGLQTVIATKETAMHTAATLEQDREKITRISTGLDEVESELAISTKLLTNFVKRMYTDKIIIAFTFLVVCGIVGIVVYAALNPNQNLFNVPTSLTAPLTTGNSTRLLRSVLGHPGFAG